MRRLSRLVFLLGLALMASTGLALAKDSVTIGMVLEPPGLDPTAAPAAAIGEVTHYNIFEGLTKTNEDKPFFASIESIETPDPMTVVLKFKQPSFEALYHLGLDTAVILDEKSA